jgi:hypothetical protein
LLTSSIVPVVAGTAAAAAYLNAKYHIAKDVKSLLRIKLSERRVIKAGITWESLLIKYD